MKSWPKIFGPLIYKLKSFFKFIVVRWKFTLPVAILLLTGVFLLQKLNSLTFAYSYSGNNCVSETLILPKNKKIGNTEYSVSHNGGLTLFSKKIISTKSCFSLQKPIAQGSVTSLKTGIFSRKYVIKIESLPIITPKPINYLNVPSDSSVEFNTNIVDKTFDYALVTNNQKVLCQNNNFVLNCNIKSLNLGEGSMYDAQLIRELQKQPLGTVSKIALVTLDPISVTGSSITNNQTVIDKPKKITLTLDKEIQSVSAPELFIIKDGKKQNIPSSSKISGNNLDILFDTELERGVNFELQIKEIRGKNGEKNVGAYVLPFKTSLGPSYSGIKLRDRALPVDQNFVVNFDQPLLAGQDFSKLIKFSVDGKESNVSYKLNGNNVTLAPSGYLPKCSAIKISILGQIQNIYGVQKDNSATFNSRTTCATVYSIGASAEGRQINAYQFGSGNSVALYIGTLHGDESNTKRLLEKWIDDIEGNPARIPSARKVIIIPLANPDGYARSSRMNARNVDLNRNFGANNWKASVKMPWGAVLDTGGGTEPFSEPETLAINNLISSKNPSHIMSFHSKASIVEANEAGNSVAIGNIYAKYSGYANKPASTNTTTFNYDTTGSMEEWGKDKLNLPIVLVELATKTDDEFYRNKDAMWSVL